MRTSGLIGALTDENKRLSRRLERERRTRQAAEEIAEHGISDLYERSREVEFLSTITMMANRAGSIREALAPVLKYVCHFIGWPAAHAHIVGDENAARRMLPSNIWYVDPDLDLSELRTATADAVFAKGEGLPGQVWESGGPSWLDDLATCDNFPRRGAALGSGIRAAFSTPLMIGSEVAGSLEFFGKNPTPADPHLLELMVKAGTQLGRLIERDGANALLAQKLRDSEQISTLLRTTLDTMMDPQALLEPVRDSSGQIVDFVCTDANEAACRELGMSPEELVGRRQLDIFSDAANSGILGHYASCIEDGKPVVLDEIPYGIGLPDALAYYDIRAVRVDYKTVNTTWRDVSERAAMSRDLAHALDTSEQARARARANTDALLDPQVLFEGVRDSNGRIVDLVYRDINVATSQYLGLSRDELIGHSCLETLPNIEGSGLLAHYIHCLETRQPLVLDEFPYNNELLDDLRYYDVRAAYAGSDSISLTWRDVTDRATMTQRVAESEERFRLLTDNSGEVVMHIRDGRFVWISPSIDKVLGMPPEHWLGREVHEMLPLEEHQAQRGRLHEIAGARDLATQVQVNAANGFAHWIYLRTKTFYDAKGRPDGIAASFRIIDDEVEATRQAEEARRLQAKADARYRTLTENSAVGMSLVNPGSGRYEVVNRSLCEFFGLDTESLQEKTWMELTAAEYLEGDLEGVEGLLASRLTSYRTITQYVHASGRLIWGDLTISLDPRHQLDQLIFQVVDVTAEIEARQRISESEQANRLLAERLQAQTDRLMSELNSSARYVASILPGELEGPVRVSPRYLPNQELGGDCFDYSWIDDDHLTCYLIDVSGHGIEPSLVSISVHNLLRSRSLPPETLLEPDQVLTELNKLFDMDLHGGNYFTMWYGVYQKSSRTLRYASAGHPPALTFTYQQNSVKMTRLPTQAIPVGMLEDTEFCCETYLVPPGCQILLYSDGLFELTRPDGTHWSWEKFTELCADLAVSPDWSVDTLIGELRVLTIGGLFEDDCTLLRLTFD